MTLPKLLIVADTYYPKVDGTLRFMEEFIKRAKDDFAISLLVPNYSHKKIDGVQNTTYISPSKIWKVSGYQNMKLCRKNFQAIKSAVKGVDIVFVQGPAMISYLSMYYSSKYQKKTVFYTHTIAWELFAKFFPPLFNKIFFNLIKRLSIFFYNRCDELLVPYHELKNELLKEGVKTRMSVAKLGIDIDLFSPTKEITASRKKVKIPDKSVIGYVGRISKEKNTQTLYEAFKKLSDQEDKHLLMVGDGPKDQIDKFKKLNNCTVTGFVNNVHDYLKAMDVFVMPSLTETTSLATLEAMSCGLPVIVTKVGFMKTYISKNHNGIFFPKNSPTMLSVKIERVLKDAEFRHKLSINARKTIAYSFSWERSINKIKRLLIYHYFNQ